MFRQVSTLAGAAALALASTAAFAADVLEPIPAAPMAGNYDAPSDVYDWNGAYVGGQVGYTFGDGTSRDNLGGKKFIENDGFTGGVYGGYNAMVTPNVVVGGEVEVSTTEDSKYTINGVPTTVQQNVGGTVSGRVGYAFDNYMVYGKAGVTVVDADAKFNGGKDSNTHVGGVIGAGVEAALTENITARAEYNYTDTNAKTYVSGAQSQKLDLDGHAVKVGVGYKF
ncbi:outer membrane protein [Methylobrevis albus]|uniref:Porin family protein n=1 Tax=Methylobrevis albus TaxID=2793297 RepID=A0A931MYK1_9HYPH|nr:outer membrane beta-barrel protein [Methylobrevis albus]MBH0238507.1 porin family protein [Methylobrevis albus]